MTRRRRGELADLLAAPTATGREHVAVGTRSARPPARARRPTPSPRSRSPRRTTLAGRPRSRRCTRRTRGPSPTARPRRPGSASTERGHWPAPRRRRRRAPARLRACGCSVGIARNPVALPSHDANRTLVCGPDHAVGCRRAGPSDHGVDVVAVAARTLERAEAAAAEWGDRAGVRLVRGARRVARCRRDLHRHPGRAPPSVDTGRARRRQAGAVREADRRQRRRGARDGRRRRGGRARAHGGVPLAVPPARRVRCDRSSTPAGSARSSGSRRSPI